MRPVYDAVVAAAGLASSLKLPDLRDGRRCEDRSRCGMAGAILALLFLVDIEDRILVRRDNRSYVSSVQEERFFTKPIEKEVCLLLSDPLQLNFALVLRLFYRSCAWILHSSCLICIPNLLNSE